MSLVYDALRRMEQAPVAQGAHVQANARATSSRRPAWPALSILMVATLAAPGAYLLARGTAGEELPMTPPATPRPLPVRIASVADTPLPPKPAPDVVPVQTAQAMSATSAPPPAPALPLTPVNVAMPPRVRPMQVDAAAAETDAVPTGLRISVDARQSPATEGDSEDQRAQRVGEVIATLEAAQARHDRDAAAAAMTRLARLLPGDSLTLLRMQAWMAHEDGQLDEALRLYGLIIGRVPDDRNASINLALLQAGRGEPAKARDRLARFAATFGSSPELARAQAQLQGARR